MVFFRISTHFTAPPGVPGPSLALKSNSFQNTSPVRLVTVTLNLLNRLHALYAQ